MKIGNYAAIERIDFIREGKNSHWNNICVNLKFQEERLLEILTSSYRRKPFCLECTNGVYQFSSTKESE